MLTRKVSICWPRDPPASASQSAGHFITAPCTTTLQSFMKYSLFLHIIQSDVVSSILCYFMVFSFLLILVITNRIEPMNWLQHKIWKKKIPTKNQKCLNAWPGLNFLKIFHWFSEFGDHEDPTRVLPESTDSTGLECGLGIWIFVRYSK